jgi:hypothetical protein
MLLEDVWKADASAAGNAYEGNSNCQKRKVVALLRGDEATQPEHSPD